MSTELKKTLSELVKCLDGEKSECSCAGSSSPFKEGKKVFIRTVTHYMVGKVVSADEKFVRLEKATWVADSKRWHNALKDGFDSSAELEPEPNDVYVAIGAIVDVREWDHELPTKQQ